MDAIKFRNAVKTIGQMANSKTPKMILVFAEIDGVVSRTDGSWVDAALNCELTEDPVEIACSFLLGDARDGYVLKPPEGA
jgi:hypothetical protein